MPYSKASYYSPNDIWYLFEEENPHLEDNALHGLEVAINSIKEQTTNQTLASPCEEKCLKTVRDITVQLLMLKWGYYGPAETTAGHYLANYRSELGLYFSNR